MPVSDAESGRLRRQLLRVTEENADLKQRGNVQELLKLRAALAAAEAERDARAQGERER
jgi:hypothetical protein